MVAVASPSSKPERRFGDDLKVSQNKAWTQSNIQKFEEGDDIE